MAKRKMTGTFGLFALLAGIGLLAALMSGGKKAGGSSHSTQQSLNLRRATYYEGCGSCKRE